MSNENEEYELNTPPPKKMDEKSEKIINDISTVLRNFALIIIIFLLMSYIANKYIAGLGINFIPMFLPVGKSFYKYPVLTSLFHPPLTDEQKKNTDFFKTIKLESGNQSEVKTYYELLQMGGNFFNIIKGLIGNVTSKETKIPMAKVFLGDYDKMWWWQKMIVAIFGAIQIFVGTAMTLFSCFAYLFSGKHAFFFNMPKAVKDKKVPTEDISTSLFSQNSNKILIKSGLTKFAAFFDFTYFIPVDKLSYGSTYFIKEPSTFGDRFKYFFLICFVLLFIGLIRGKNLGGFFVIFLIFILFGGWVLNPKHNPHPYCNYVSMLEKVNEYLPNKMTYNQLAEKILGIKGDIEQAISTYSDKTKEAAEGIGYEPKKDGPVEIEMQPMSGGKLKPHLRKKIKEIRLYMKENNIQL